MMQKALYYPDVLPPSDWLRRSMLFYDATASVVDQNFYSRAGEDLRWLVDRGHFEPLKPQSLQPQEVSAVAREFTALLSQLPPEAVGEAKTELLYKGKLPGTLFASLDRYDLVDTTGDDHRVAATVQQLLFGLLSQHLAHARSRPFSAEPTLYSLHTEALAIERYLTMVMPGRDTLHALDLLVQGLVPTPPPDVSMPEIIAFRTKHESELQDLWLVLEEIVRPGTDLAAIGDLRRRVEAAVVRLDRDERYRRWRVAGESAAIALTGASVALQPAVLDVEALHWIFSGVGVTVSSTLVSRTVRRQAGGGQTDVRSYRYLKRLRKEYR